MAIIRMSRQNDPMNRAGFVGYLLNDVPVFGQREAQLIFMPPEPDTRLLTTLRRQSAIQKADIQCHTQVSPEAAAWHTLFKRAIFS